MKRWLWFLATALTAVLLGAVWYFNGFGTHAMDPLRDCGQDNVIGAQKAIAREFAQRVRPGIYWTYPMGLILGMAAFYFQLLHAQLKTFGGFVRGLIAFAVAAAIGVFWLHRAIDWSREKVDTCLAEALEEPVTARLVPIPGLQFGLVWNDAIVVQGVLAALVGVLSGILVYWVLRRSTRV